MAIPQTFAGKVIALTGAAGGIGFATAKFLAARGASLSLSDISTPGIQNAVVAIEKQFSTPVMGTTVDVGDSSSVNAWIETTLERFGRLDGAANIAATLGRNRDKASSKKIWEVDEDEYDFITRVNQKGVWNCLRAELKAMGVEAGPNAQNPHGGGSIVNIASVAGLMGRENASSYTASKHAVIGLSRTAAKEAGPMGVRVNVVAPGYVDTDMMVYIDEEVKQTALRRVGQPEEVAGLIAWLLGGEGSGYVTGQVYGIEGGWPGLM